MHIGTTMSLKLIEKEYLQEKIVRRQLCLVDSREDRSKVITHLEYLLPISTNDEYEHGQCTPTVFTKHLLDFINQVVKCKSQLSQCRYTAIHCG